MESCMCKAEHDLNVKYTAEYLVFHELVFWIDLLTKSAGVSFLGKPGLTPPGLQFLDPKRREYLLSRNARAHEQVGAVFGGYPSPATVKAVVTLSRLADERTPAGQRAAEWFIDNLPDGHPKTGIKLLLAWRKYWKTVAVPE
ncbi:MAG: hypothetical protein A3C16_01815 [Candidatus Sungbacteria bacterium RIFCSPHIGHO2_02_FULL_51_29]|uniref:Uncharacterized protein n=1 Tax=Candidatus Sungbacteria bacterium RIFCSPHIGHO2_02_FULL_51_29 TaxID=1802273 RepID=A0A1G2KWM9_9BACT|nr:MAG: hypothetical protein A3C16_01815 [Candidatus Sungbacteria bacterium RIFCSPHIGHO2_02_FULL_51_29]